MLALPDKGVRRSVNEHNSKLDVFCDWIEGSILFSEEELSETDIVDVLLEEQIYKDQSFASERVADVWAELKRRQILTGVGSSFSIEHRKIKRLRSWQDVPAHSFCAILSFVELYDGWASRFGSDYNEQGELFELLTQESLKCQFPGWQIYRTGWSRTTTVKLAQVVEDIQHKLGELPGSIGPWASKYANEVGLDLLCYRPFDDNRVGIPVYLMQCASGGDWKRKLHTPDLQIWTKVVQFAADPKKAFATPFAFLDDTFRQTCNTVDGMLLDRYRLLAPYRHIESWESRPLKDRIIAWAEPRILALLRSDV